jgi:hypothetical protein
MRDEKMHISGEYLFTWENIAFQLKSLTTMKELSGKRLFSSRKFHFLAFNKNNRQKQ